MSAPRQQIIDGLQAAMQAALEALRANGVEDAGVVIAVPLRSGKVAVGGCAPCPHTLEALLASAPSAVRDWCSGVAAADPLMATVEVEPRHDRKLFS